MKILSKIMIVICIVLVIFTVIFSTNNPISNKYKLLIVMSGSMEPVIDTKDVILVKKENDYKRNDIIAFAVSETKSYTHRVVDVNEEGFITKGDANNANDSDVVIIENVIGKYLFSIPLIGSLILAIKQIPTGYVMLFILLALGIIVFYLVYGLLTRVNDFTDSKEEESKREKLYDVSDEED